MSAPVLKVIPQRETHDCAIAALAMYLGASYEDVLRVVTVTDRKQGRAGLWGTTMIRIAKRLGHRMRVRTTVDWDADYGILRLPDHAVILRNGLVIDTDGMVWDADAYLATGRRTAVNPDDCELLVCEG